MTDRPSRRWIPVAATVALAAVLLIAAILILPNSGKTTTVTSLRTTTAATSALTSLQTTGAALSASDYNSSLGLRLTLSISNGTVPRDDGVSLHISLNNTLATQNDLPPPNGPSSSYSSNLLLCSNWPIEVQMFQGNYAPGNLSQASPLNVLNPSGGGQGCPSYPRSEISLAPMSSDITSPVGWSVNQSSDKIEYWGYWTGTEIPPSDNVAFNSFTPGLTYTVEGADWWGQVTLLHFQVVANDYPFDCTTIASNPAFVESDNFSSSAGRLTLQRYYADLQSKTTVVLALTATGNSTLAVSNPSAIGPFLFSPNSSLTQSFQYYSPNGTLGYPVMVFPGGCSLVSINLEQSELPFVGGIELNFKVGNQTQTFTVSP
jgi:hypothetical protein